MKKRIFALLLSLLMMGLPALASETDVITNPGTETEVLSPSDPATNVDTDADTPEVAVPSADAETSDTVSAPDPTESDDNADIGSVAPVNPFEDVKADSPFLPGILYAVEKKITNGTTATTFSPYSICTHAQILTFLWRAWGSPKPTIENPFPNVKTNAYYYQAALWSYEKGLIDTTFDPYAYCTRLQAVTYMWKLAGSPSVYAQKQDQFPFTDVPEDADSRNAIAWASMEQSITNGTTATTFSPAKRCTRAQIVTFIYRGRDLFGNQA